MVTDQPPQSSSISPVLAFDSEGASAGPSPSGPYRYRTITHAAALTAFVLPFFLLPYLLTRRQTSLIHRRVDEVATTVRMLQQDLNGISSEFAVRKDEHRRLKALVYDTMRETDELRTQAEQLEKNQTASDEWARSDIQRLLDEAQRTRTQVTALRALGTSLADVAAFMHEIELEMGMNQGKDHRGIEKLRRLALRMESLPQQDNAPSGQPVKESAGQSS